MRRERSPEAEPLPADFDLAALEVGWPEARPSLLAGAVAAGVLTPSDVVLLVRTRIEEPSAEPPRPLAAPTRPCAKSAGGPKPPWVSLPGATSRSGIVMGQPRTDALHVGGVEVLARLGQPATQRCAVSPGIDGPGTELPQAEIVGRTTQTGSAASRPRRNRRRPRVRSRGVVAHSATADHDRRTQVLLVHPVVGVGRHTSKGRPRISLRASVRRARAASSSTVSASRLSRWKMTQSDVHPVDEIARRRRKRQGGVRIRPSGGAGTGSYGWSCGSHCRGRRRAAGVPSLDLLGTAVVACRAGRGTPGARRRSADRCRWRNPEISIGPMTRPWGSPRAPGVRHAPGAGPL